MRLTLRTLLAYLDDVLEPSQTREIGQKIQESPVAAALVSRVREVIRRRRLGSPQLTGPEQGLEPNIVAQYLDNTLADQHVADVERVCLESDVQLAEVAACHQILTLVLGEPQEVRPQSLERFYTLGPVNADERVTVAKEKPKAAERTPAGPVIAAAIADHDIPDHLKPAPWSQRFAPVALVLIVMVAAILTLVLDPELARSLLGNRAAIVGVEPRRDATATPQRPVSPVRSNDANPATAAATTSIDTKATDVVATTPAVAAVADRAAMLPTGIDPTPPPDVPEPAKSPSVAPTAPMPAAPGSPATAAVTATPSTVAVVPDSKPLPAAPVPSDPAALPAKVPEAAPPKVRVRVNSQYTSTDGVLIRYDPADSHWFVQPRRSEVHLDETFACPDPFEAVLELDSGRVKARMLGETVVKIVNGTEAQPIALEQQRGRLILQPGTGATAGKPASLSLSLRGLTYDVVLKDAATIVGFEVQLRDPAGRTLPPVQDSFRAAVFVSSGSATLTSGEKTATLVAGDMRWLTANPPDAASSSMPPWMDSERRKATSVLQRYALLFEKEFDPATAVDLSIPALVKDPRPKMSELATRCLCVMEAHGQLAQALGQAEHEESRKAAASGLRRWMVQGADRPDLLRQELQANYPGGESEAVFQLLMGYTPAEAQDRIVGLQLIEWLKSNFVEIRELSIEQLERLTGRRYDYRPLASPSQREPAIQRWNAHLDREGALVKPAP